MLVQNWKEVLAKSATVWMAVINIVVYVADHMEYLDMVPQKYRTTLQAVLLALIPLARIIKQQSLHVAQPVPVTDTIVKEPSK